MNFTGEVRQIKHSAEKRMFEIVIETAETRPQFFTLTYFEREGKIIPKTKPGDIIYAAAELRGRQWIDPETGTINYFMSLMATEIVIIKGGQNEN